jgi:hypothetical protein
MNNQSPPENIINNQSPPEQLQQLLCDPIPIKEVSTIEDIPHPTNIVLYKDNSSNSIKDNSPNWFQGIPQHMNLWFQGNLQKNIEFSENIAINIQENLPNTTNITNTTNTKNITNESDILASNPINVSRNNYQLPRSKLKRTKSLTQISMDETSNIVVQEPQYDSCCEVSSCCKKLVKFEIDAYEIIRILPISAFRKEILKRRYSDNIGDYQQNRDCVRFIYRLFQIIIAIGSVIIPSLLSVLMTEYVKLNNYEVKINIIVLSLSIIMSICIHVIQIFKLDELYYNYAITVEKLKSIWYHYSSLSGPFIGSTHNESFTLFINMMEEIIINQKFQEYVDSKSDKNKPKKEQEYFYNDLNEYKNIIAERNTIVNNDIYDDYTDEDMYDEV